jgi:hypothetical protein
MRRSRKVPFCAALVALILPVVAGCSSSGSDASTSTTTTNAAAATTTTGKPSLPATGSVDGVTLSATSSPASGTVGTTVIRITAVLKGTVVPATLDFQVSNRAAATTGSPESDQRISVTGPGTYVLPHPYSPKTGGAWASTVTYIPKKAGASRLSVSGLPPVAGAPAPFPQLVTTVTAS